MFLRTFNGLITVGSKIFTDVNLLNTQAHIYQPYGHSVTKKQTPFLDILAASKIPAKCGHVVKTGTTEHGTTERGMPEYQIRIGETMNSNSGTPTPER